MSTKFPTSESIYNWIRSDPIFNPTKASISYYDSVKDKYITAPLCTWKTIKDGGDVPWHRIYSIKYDNNIHWDRNEKKCTMDELHESLFTTKQNELPNKLKIMTWNILNDIYDNHLTNLNKRKQQIFQFIINNNYEYDIICLQEINNDIYNEIIQLFHHEYNIISTELKTNNIILMSKIPFKNYEIIHLSSDKEVICANINNELQIFGVHLTSNSRGNSQTKRDLQISQIMQKYNANNTINNINNNNINTIIIGDFNTTKHIELLTNFIHIETIDYSYNPINNKLAKIFSKHFKCEKYDTLYLNDSNQYKCIASHVFTDIEASDHYPVEFIIEKSIINETIVLNNELLLLNTNNSLLLNTNNIQNSIQHWLL